jgi:hypothetical protein
VKEINIPFTGFYESRWSHGIDRAENLDVEHFVEEKEMEEGDVAEIYWNCMDYRKAREYVAKQFVEYYQDHLAELLGFKVKLHYSGLESPKEYNFRTDRIFAKVSDKTIRRMFKVVDKDRLTAVAKERHTSCSGFISFYRPDWKTWGHVDTWDLNQLGTLVRALHEDEGWEWTLCEEMDEGGVFTSAVDEALNFPKFEAKLEERRLILAGEIEEDGRKFPYGEGDPAQYVAKFCDLNHLRKT